MRCRLSGKALAIAILLFVGNFLSLEICKIIRKVEARYLYQYLFPVNFHKKTVLAVTILLRKVAR
jgi:hypothetical protein